MEISQFILDFGIMLGVAAVITIIFKKLHFPVILGYIFAGFLIGPYFPLFMTVKSLYAIENWGEIGIIAMMFYIGLSFDFKKLKSLGATPITASVIKMGGSTLVGYCLGRIAGLGHSSSLILGIIISITSTITVKKCLEGSDKIGDKIQSLLMSSLVIEDIIAVIIMVVLAAIGETAPSTSELAIKLGIMLAFLIVWVLLGAFAIPKLANSLDGHLDREMLTIFAMGLCFVMALASQYIGFGTALGGFVAGSLLSTSSLKDKVSEYTTSIKDVFGAVFFLWVGMKIDPVIITKEWKLIILIVLVSLIAKLIFAILGMLLSGQDISTSIVSGIALAPIGELSFVIASLGIELELLREELFPIIVASAIITIIASPLLIKFVEPLTNGIERILPQKLKNKLNDYTSKMQSEHETSKEWKKVINNWLSSILIYGAIIFCAGFVIAKYLEPFMETIMPDVLAKSLCLLGTILITAIFAWPMMKFHNPDFSYLWLKRRANRLPLSIMIFAKFLILIALLFIPVEMLFDVEPLISLVLVVAVIILLVRTDFIPDYYLTLENKFLSNLSKTNVNATNKKHWLSEDYNIFSFIVPSASTFTGKSIGKLNWGKYQKVYVAKIKRAKKSLVVPGPRVTLQGGDKVYVIGDDSSLKTFHKTLGLGRIDEVRTLKEFLQGSDSDKEHLLACLAIPVSGEENYAGKTIKRSGIMRDNHVLVLGIEKKGRQTIMPDPNTRIDIGDILWVIGSEKNLKAIGSRTVGERG